MTVQGESGCVFCRIARGEAPASMVLEDDGSGVVAFMDIAPASRGHLLVVPVRHAVTLWDLTEEEAAAIFRVARRIAGAMRETLGFDGLNVLQSNGAAAGQVVFHFHLHLIPRYAGGEGLAFRLRPPTYTAPERLELDAVADRLRRALEASSTAS
ncbi:HIT family protein [Carboxydochorda subterranea]|uniref:HIT family protein n=1 Tax=Carboxydichorda subterranea TaxID=3109565 RepID=A0ABZ1C0K6_9FIRM|nr:HIT family protein [Limnochorda sp. L945t]WRP18624.1 HIT family protein [Limnochorda sp. L945t]